MENNRMIRRSLFAGALAAAGFAVAAPFEPDEPKKKPGPEQEEDVSTNEDLMREHGILKRALLVYRESSDRLDRRQDVDPKIITGAAVIIRDFIEKYHEKLEEDHLFPRFRKANQLVDLVTVLEQQHKAGRIVTARILATAADAGKRRELISDLRSFVRMYEPHEAREDTVLFPALHKIVSKHEYDAMGEQFEKIEHRQFGGDGFDIYVDKISAIEKRLGTYDLSQFTPRT